MKAGSECDKKILVLTDGHLNQGITEIALGDLVSEEKRDFVLLMEVLPLPLLPNGELPGDLLQENLQKISSGNLTARNLKEMVYESRYRTRSSTHDLHIDPGAKPKAKSNRKRQRRQPEQ
jgi:hypothetical protein